MKRTFLSVENKSFLFLSATEFSVADSTPCGVVRRRRRRRWRECSN